jgi:hypothetical protein
MTCDRGYNGDISPKRAFLKSFGNSRVRVEALLVLEAI